MKRYRSSKKWAVSRRYNRAQCGFHQCIQCGGSVVSAYRKYFINGNFWILRPNDPDVLKIVAEELFDEQA